MSGEKPALEFMENAYGGVPPVATIVQPAYPLPCVPPGHEAVVIANAPPDEVVTVTFAVAVMEPVKLVAVTV